MNVFDGYAKSYDAALAEGLSWSGEDRSYFARTRIEILGKRLASLHHRPSAVMDFGCGDGSSTAQLLALPGVQRVVGVDVSEASISLARQRFERANVSFKTPHECLGPARFDLAFCNGVFHHIPVSGRASAVDDVSKALRPGGLFALWENNPWNPGTRLVMSRIPFDKDAITLSYREARHLVHERGFEVLSSEFAFYFPRLLALLRCMEPWLRRIPLGAQYMVLARKPE